MLLIFHPEFDMSLLLTYQLICLHISCLRINSFAFFAHFHQLAVEEKAL